MLQYIYHKKRRVFDEKTYEPIPNLLRLYSIHTLAEVKKHILECYEEMPDSHKKKIMRKKLNLKLRDIESKRFENNQKIKISIIVSSKDRSEKLKKFLESINEDDMFKSNSELVLIDNNSRDETNKIMKKHKEKVKYPVQILFEKTIGKSFALNKGMKNANGNWFIFVDDDCRFTKNYLYYAYKTIETENNINFFNGQI